MRTEMRHKSHETWKAVLPCFHIFLTVMLCLGLSSRLMSQTTQQNQSRKRHFAVYAGIGPNFYFNNLDIGHNLVHPWNYTFVTRVMWEPEHLLSVGIESGYILLYTVKSSTPVKLKIANSAIPIHLVVSMKFFHGFYFNFTMGQSRLQSKVTQDSVSGDFNSKNWSLGDFGVAFGYRRRLNDRFTLGAEFKGFYSTKYEDKNIALVFVAGFRF